ncbi:L-threonylcarbamoyladenylate synthase [Nocardiopsis halotolerans]|uniref:hypothetical protein n=1 Tax=Nocardiopsis halotolerans TaxID=124252 RepID=UPI00034D0025|nr:hypothetical protein [Nocardiopsis halotolerans]
MSPDDGTRPRTPVTLAEARQALGRDTAIVLPNPAPLTHVITATTASAVNRAKGRAPQQPVALWAHHPDTLRTLDGVWALTYEDRMLARRLLTEEHLTVLLPLHAQTERPAWLEPAVKDGWVLLFGTRWQPLRPLLDDHPVLYVSSANRTGHPPAATTGEALAMFPAAVPVLERPGPGWANPAVGETRRRATTTVRITGEGQLRLHRHGAQDRRHLCADAYLRHLRARYTAAGGRTTAGSSTGDDPGGGR